MILLDTGPLVALFDPDDSDHRSCDETLDSLEEPLLTTLPVLTEAFHLLNPATPGSHRLMDFVLAGGVALWWIEPKHIERVFELMVKYGDHPMDLADASLVVAAEQEKLTRIFTLDRDDFSTYRIKRGHRHVPFEVIP